MDMSYKYYKWIKEKKLIEFSLKANKIFCSPCSEFYGEKKKSTKYISVGASPKKKHLLFHHLQSKTHLKVHRLKISLNNRKMLKKNNCKKTKKKKGINNITFENSKNKKLNTNSNFNTNTNDINIENLNEEEKCIIPLIKLKLEVVFYMMLSNVPNNHFSSLQMLINNISNNKILTCFLHNSASSFNDFANILYNTYIKILNEKINYFLNFGITIDDSTSISNVNQINIFINYINSELKPFSSFLAVKDLGVEGGKSTNLKKIIIETFEEFKIKKENLVSFSSDGASNMIGKYNGLSELLKEK
jgi:hypothetical protein